MSDGSPPFLKFNHMAKTDSKAKAGKTDSKAKATVSVETVKAPKPPKGAVTERVSGSHRVKFMPNGVNPKLGDKMMRPAADTAQMLVDKGYGHIIAE